MARRVVSVLRQGPGGLRAADPVLEAHAYAVASDLDLTVVLRGDAVELAVDGEQPRAIELAGVALPSAVSGQDLRALLESGIPVCADGGDVARRGLAPADLIDGVDVADDARLDELLRSAEAVLSW